ncbi:hypothetical protein HA402_008261 [Bradysia odoriphaga]|nr:hypothetical protein HA402_008261 [Bradysia odoriphaga]
MSKNKGSWSLALTETMKDPSYRVISSEVAVAIKDKFPKAKYHFLILPYEDIVDVYHLTSSEKHLKLMDEMELLAKNVIEVTDVHSEVKQNGKVFKPAADVCKRLLATELKCHHCDFSPKNMPDLKHHLISHIT